MNASMSITCPASSMMMESYLYFRPMRRRRFSAACVTVIAVMRACFKRRYSLRLRCVRSTSKARALSSSSNMSSRYFRQISALSLSPSSTSTPSSEKNFWNGNSP
eukprot:scaffold748_cov251-Pinguiococcus_pyrenoidosus.AAC.10